DRRHAAVEADRHAGDGRALVVGGDVVDAGQELARGAAAGAVQDADGVQGDAVRDTGRLAGETAADGARGVRAVAVAVVAVLAVADGVVQHGRAAAELDVRRADAGVEHVDVHARAGVGVRVRAGQRQCPLVDAVQAPGVPAAV